MATQTPLWQVEPLGQWTRPVTQPRVSSARFRASWDDTLGLLLAEVTLLAPTGAVAVRLDVTDCPEVAMPAGAPDLLDMWALVDPVAPLVPRPFRVVGTGNPVPTDCGRFVGTVPVLDGRLIFHVFEGGPPPDRLA